MPSQPKIYHIVHIDRLASIIASNGLLCDAQMMQTSFQVVVFSLIGLGDLMGRDSLLWVILADANPVTLSNIYAIACCS